MPSVRLAIVVSHPIQHFVHLYRALAAREDITLKLFFATRIGVEKYFDADMGTEIAWAGDMLAGYDHEFLPEAPSIKRTSFRTVNNPSIGPALTRFAPDAVIIYGYSQLTQLRALRWANRRRVPVLMISDSNAVTERTFVKRIARQLILRRIYRRIAGFLSPGDQNEDLLARYGVPRAKMFRSPFTIDEARYRQARQEREAARVRIRAHHEIPEDAFVLLFVGKLIARKRPQDALRAVARAAAAGVKAHLVLCGNGPMMAELETLAREVGAPATFAGFVNIDVLPDYFAASDALLHPAEHDPHPLICSEAIAVGLPMILSDKVGTIGKSDVSRAGENTLVAPCGDVAALAAAVESLAADPARYRAMQMASLQIFEETNLDASVSGVVAALAAVVKRTPPEGLQ